MLSKFFTALKPKDYSVQILKDSTSQSAVKRIKRTRTSAPFRKIATLTLVLSILGGGLASATAATAVTAKQAQANIIADMVCIKTEGDNVGAWNGGANVYGVIGGRAQYGMTGAATNIIVDDSAFAGKQSDWGVDGRPYDGAGAPDDGAFLTAYEKYGLKYPLYDSWVPAFADKTVSIKQVDLSNQSYSTVDGKLPVKGGNNLDPGTSPLTTSDVGACLAFMPAVSAGISNMISALPRLVMSASIELYAAAYGSSMSQPDSVLYAIGQSIDKFITQDGGLRDSLFIPFIMPLLLIGACWVGYVGVIKRSAIQAVQSTGWMIIAIALGTVFLAQPTLISSYVDNTVYTVQGVVNEAVLKNSNSTGMCELTGSNYKVTVRETKCTIWHSTIYTTWVAGQFGDGASSSSGGSSVLTQQAGRDVLNNPSYRIFYGHDWRNAKQAETWGQFMIDRQATIKKLELSEVAWAQLSGANGAKINADWAGSMGMISSAILMFFGAGASSAVLFVYGFSLLIYQLMMISAVLMSPFFFLFGIVPNWGRRVLMRYAEIIVSLAVKRIITASLLAFYLLFYNLIIGDAALSMLLLKLIIIAALAMFFISSRAKFVNMFADNINFGGNKSVGLPGNKAIAVTAGIGAGLLGGGLIGAAIVGSKARKNNKDLEGSVKNMKLEGGSPTADIKTPPRGPNSGGEAKAPNPIQAVSKVNGAINDAKSIKEGVTQVNDFRNKLNNTGAQAPQNTPNGPGGTTPTISPAGASQAGPAASGASAGSGVSGAAASSAGSSGAASAATAGAAGAGAKVAPAAAKIAGSFAGSGGAAATGTTAAGAAGGIVSGGAAAGGAGVAAGGAAAAAGGTAAAGGAVAAGAAAGSVVPVIGTVVGAAAAAAAVNIAKKKAAEKGKE